jgi:hypothetical protein
LHFDFKILFAAGGLNFLLHLCYLVTYDLDLIPIYIPHRIRELSTFSLLFGAGAGAGPAEAGAEAKQATNAAAIIYPNELFGR